jgi:Xaa-Pro aminopeptidase
MASLSHLLIKFKDWAPPPEATLTSHGDSASPQMVYHSEMGERVFRGRLRRVQRMMAEQGFGSLIVVGQPQFFPSNTGNIRYIANWALYSGYTTMVLTAEGDPVILVDLEAKRKQFLRCTWISDVRVARYGSLGEAVFAVLSERGASGSVGSVGLDLLPAKTYEEIVGTRRIKDAKHIFQELRMVKTREEILELERSAKASDAMFGALFEATRPGVWAYKVRAEAIAAALKEGSEWASVWISSGKAAPIDGRGYTPYDGAWRRFRKGDQVNVGTYLIRQGYWGHGQRSAVVGEPTRAQAHTFELVEEAYSEAVAAIKPGKRVIEIDMAARRVLEREGLNMTMRNGHSIGMDYQEQPLSAAFPDEQLLGEPNLESVLKEGMVFEVHIAAQYGEDGLAACIGDMCAVTSSSVRRLTRFPRGLNILR